MAGQVQWLNGQANVEGIVEKICPKRHIRQNQWQREWNQAYETHNDYISDYECVFKYPINVADNRWAAAKQQGTNVPITNLAHFTSQENAVGIIDTGGFRGGMKKINEDAQGDDIKVRDTLGAAIQPFLGQYDDPVNLQNQFATSDAFTTNPRRYGNRHFQYEINELCQYYADSIHDEVKYKILGTFGYKQEIMHAVLVCSQADGDGRFGAYPPVLTKEEDVNNEAVVTRCNYTGNWTWKPQATGGTEIRRLRAHWQNSHTYRRWKTWPSHFIYQRTWSSWL
ncbi:hypothetical protein OS493_031236 [Desmophyllum pertusum]|uniref:Uncharacterized protein n=1 Tax=Desmophyllum pertusum TaxID=174260 RepID=A0A9X0CXE2_9CNID|nr:hypothetical protein OS493_031236 [Desmophyllum pertusum]